MIPYEEMPGQEKKNKIGNQQSLCLFPGKFSHGQVKMFHTTGDEEENRNVEDVNQLL